MTRAAVALGLAAAFVACTSEIEFIGEPPFEPLGNAIPVEDTTQIDTVIQVVPPVVDVLWVIDNSCSMQDEQDALVANFPSFISYFLDSGVDYHIGVVSTDLDDSDESGQLRAYETTRYIDPETKDAAVAFNAMANVGTEGSGSEKGRGAVYTAIEIRRTLPSNAGFYRNEAGLHTILISDEDDDTPDFLISHQEFIDWYRSLKRPAWRKTFSSIVSPPSNGPFDGTPYLDLTDAIGGIPWNINSPNWGEVLDRLGVQASGLQREFFLTQRPVPGTIDVEITEVVDGLTIINEYAEVVYDNYGTRVAGDWTYDQARNSISFVDFTPEPLAQITITYTLLSSAIAPGGG